MILALHAFLGGALRSPGASRGIDPDGQGTVTDQKLYQLIRQIDGVDEGINHDEICGFAP